MPKTWISTCSVVVIRVFFIGKKRMHKMIVTLLKTCCAFSNTLFLWRVSSCRRIQHFDGLYPEDMPKRPSNYSSNTLHS